MHLEIDELISIDMKAIMMLGCMIGATFFFIIFQLRAHAADAAVWLLCLRDGRKSTAHAVRIRAVCVLKNGYDSTVSW